MKHQNICVQCLTPTFNSLIVFWFHHILMLFWFLALSLNMLNSFRGLPEVVSKPGYSTCWCMTEDRMGTTSLKRGLPLCCCRTNILISLRFPGQSRTPVLNGHALAVREKHCQNRQLHHAVL